MSHCRLCRGSPSRRSLSCGICQRVLQDVAAKNAAIDKARQLALHLRHGVWRLFIWIIQASIYLLKSGSH